MRILFVGSNPSTTSTHEDAFHESTRSGKLLSSWFKDIDADKLYVNVADYKTDNNKPLKRSEIIASLGSLSKKIADIRPDKIVALGKTASTALTLLRSTFFELPHPSGCNRLLNDPNYIKEKIKRLVEFINEP